MEFGLSKISSFVNVMVVALLGIEGKICILITLYNRYHLWMYIETKYSYKVNKIVMFAM